MHESYVFIDDVYWSKVDIAHTKVTGSMVLLWKSNFTLEWALGRERRSVVLPWVNLETGRTEKIEDVV